MKKMFDIAGITFSVNSDILWDCGEPMLPFINSGDRVNFSIEIVHEPVLGTFKVLYNSSHSLVQQSDKYTLYNIYAEHGTLMTQLIDNGNFSYTIYNRNSCYSKVISSAFILYGLNHKVLSIHASAITFNNGGYIWLGKSGRGKSTHSQLWVKNIPNCELLNDDNPILRIENNQILLYGSPWSGKTPCYKNFSVPLKGIVQLRRGKSNKIIRVSKLKAISIILPCIIGDKRWEHTLHSNVLEMIGMIVDTVPVYEMWCTPTPEAAFICKSVIV